MSTIGSSISAAAQCGLEMNEAIRAYNENELAQIKLNAAANKAANSMTMSSADATLIGGLAEASQARSNAFGLIAGAVTSGAAGLVLIKMEDSYAKAGAAAAKNETPSLLKGTVIKETLDDIELPDRSAASLTASNGSAPKPDAKPSVNNDNNNRDDGAPKVKAAEVEVPITGPPVLTQKEVDAAEAKAAAKKAKALIKRVKGPDEIAANQGEARMDKIGRFLPTALSSMGQSSGQLAGAQDIETKAKAQALASAAGGIEKLLEANASTATQSQQSAQSLKEALIKAQAEMIMANRA